MAFTTEKVSHNDYRLLGLSPAASPAEVKKAYRDLVKRWHPDFFHQRSLFERQRAEERFKEITGAYRRISLSWKSGEPIDRSSGHQRTTSESKPAPKSPSGPQPFTAAGASHGANRSGKPLNRSSGFSPFRNMDFRSFARFVSQRCRPDRLRRDVKWDGRSAGIFLFVLIFLIVFAITSIPVRRWFFPPPENGVPESVPAHPKMVPEQPLDRPLAEDKSLTPGSDGLQTMPPRPESPPASPPTVSTRLHFALGSTQTEVLRVQGTPNRIHGQTWIYGLSEIQFKDGRVWRYNNFDGSLRVQMVPKPVPEGGKPLFITLGSTKNDVLLVQGTPTRVEANKWFYGFSEIRFKNEVVDEYDNYFENLNIRLLPSTPSLSALQKGFFTVGSTADDVLNIQGTPTSIQGHYWFYQLSSILFRDKRVHYVVNSGGNLHFVPPEEAIGESVNR
jgi:hypothetical protein